ncbi:MAG TPA: DUF3568 family protein [Opitutaceae bacterium]|nr:DUF3568 family protein [Opitutaceae bacterium]
MKFSLPARTVVATSVFSAVVLLGSTGCTHVQVDPDTTGEYKLGELQVFADRDFAAVHAAATRALKEAKLFQTKDDRKVIEAELNGRDSTDTLVVIKIKEVGKNRTSVKIRYGVLKPNLAAAQKLYQSMEKFM